MAGRETQLGFEWSVDSIVVGVRHRKDLGDLGPLMESIAEHGLLQLPTVTVDGVLVCGARRLEAVKRLGWRRVNVWIVAGLSDRLAQAMAERDENTARKDYTPSELADLYEELKQEIAADAARREESTRFQDGHRYGDHGVGNLPMPLGAPTGDSRAQASKMAGAGKGYKTLEKILAVRRWAADPARPAVFRARAAEAVTLIDAGGKIDPLYTRLRLLARLDDFEKMAADDTEIDQVRVIAGRAVEQIRGLGADDPASQVVVDRVIRDASEQIKQVRDETKNATARVSRKTPPTGKSVKRRSVKHFVWTWTQLADWTSDYDPGEIARTLTAAQWEAFQQTMADSARFTEQVTGLRGELGLDPQPTLVAGQAGG